MATAINQVLAYEKMGTRYKRRYKPRILHREDCRHAATQSIFRPATEEELRTLPRCKTCEVQEAKEQQVEPDASMELGALRT